MQGLSEEQTQRILCAVQSQGSYPEPTATISTRAAMEALNSMFCSQLPAELPGAGFGTMQQLQKLITWRYGLVVLAGVCSSMQVSMQPRRSQSCRTLCTTGAAAFVRQSFTGRLQQR